MNSSTINESEVVAVNMRLVRRLEREERARVCAKRRLRAEYKSLPKREREQLVEAAREAKYEFIRQESGFGSYGLAASAIGVGVAGACLGGYAARKHISGFASQVRETLTSVNTAAKGVTGVTERAIGVTDYLYDLVKRIYDLCASSVGLISRLIFGVFVIATKAMFGLTNMASRLFDSVILAIAPDYSFGEIFTEEDITPQAGLFSYIPQIVALVCTSFVPTYNCKTFTGEIMRRVSSFDRTAAGFSSIFASIAQMTQDTINVVLRFFGLKELRLIGESQRSVMEWIRQVDQVFEKIDTSNPSIKDLTHANTLVQTGYNLKKITTAVHLSAALERCLEKLNHKLVVHKGILNADNAFRQQPILCMFGGESGIGKTNLIKTFAGAVLQLADLCEPDECAQQMWQKGDSEYFNGYAGQLVYIMDDVFQKKEVAGGSENEGFTIIRAVSNWPFPLNFADVESKGRWYFSSKLMIGTTNESDIQGSISGVLRKPEAVIRRIEHGYWLGLNSAYQKEGRLDYAKLEREYRDRLEKLLKTEGYTQEDVLRCYPWEAFKAVPHAFAGAPPVLNDTAGVPIMDIIRDVAETLKDRAAKHVESSSKTLDWLRALAEAKKRAVVPEEIVPQAGVSQRDSDSDCDFVEEYPEGYPYSTFYMESEPVEGGVRYKYLSEEAQAALDAQALELERRATAVTGIRAILASIPSPLLGALGLAAGLGGLFAGYCVMGKIVAIFNKVVRFACDLITSLYKAVKEFIFGSTPEPQSVHVDQKVMPRKKAKTEPPSIQMQMGNPPSDGIANLVYKNTYKLVLHGEDGPIPVGQVLMVRECVGIMPHHFLDQPDGRIEFVSCAPGGHRVSTTMLALRKCPKVPLPDADMVFIDLKAVLVRAHRDIVKHFVTDKTWSSLTDMRSTGVRLDVARLDEEGKLERHVMYSSFLRYDPEITTVKGVVKKVWAYDCPTRIGDCGGVLTIAEPCHYGGKAVLGVHIAGKTTSLMAPGSREGFSCCLTLELVSKALEKFRPIKDSYHEGLKARGVELTEEPDEIVQQSGLVGGSITYVGTMPHTHSISQAGRSKLIRTTFNGWGECPVAPAPLRPVYREGILVKPMHQAMLNYRKPVQACNVENGGAIMALAMKQHTRLTMQSTRRVLSFDEAVLGVPAMKIKNINRSSSPGWPWRLECPEGKRSIFGDGVEFDLTTPECQAIRERVAEIISCAAQGERLDHTFCDFLKDETRPMAKVEAVATRAISGAPVDYTIAVRMYFGAFISACFMHHTRSGMAPGINYYCEWSTLATELLRKGSKMFAGDFKAFDAHEQPDVHGLILEHINNWYDQFGADPEGRLIRTVLFEDLIHSRHLTGDGYKLDTVVQWNKSLPSGHPLTTTVNSMYSLYTLTACYVHLTKDYEAMWDHVFLCTFGDDNVGSVDDDTIDVFNQVSIAKAMDELFHMTYTSDKKDQEITPFESIDDITFLKRSFRRSTVDGGWIAPLHMDSILYRTYFYHNPRNYFKDQAVNFREALMELSLHDECEWSQRFEAAANYCRDSGIEFTVVSREAARQACLARTDCWF
uniref:Nonstructural polyprotein n=1 Tax=Biomphalaria pfeifferi virus 2 TaxID=2884320 RepID=A0A8K1P8C4_9VIRU|nr:MAG: nonstructural polyprotein [Biomphalaria pfeifferi virus 2]